MEGWWFLHYFKTKGELSIGRQEELPIAVRARTTVGRAILHFDIGLKGWSRRQHEVFIHLLAHGQSKRSVTASTANIPASGGSFVRIFQKHFVIEDGACRASHLHLT
jgi:hypothetical protein